MRYIRSTSTDPYFNLALEEYVFQSLDPSFDSFMLWQNDNAIIIGKHQNTAEEINASFVKEHDIRVARRLSGGGAVYHDMGNLNFTFITAAVEGRETSAFRRARADQSDDKPGIDFSVFCEPIIDALASLGVQAELSGRNDMTIDGKKFSGNAQYAQKGRVMHHGTLMFDSDLSVLTQALNVSRNKIESKGIKSIASRVTNIAPYLTHPWTLNDFWKVLETHIDRLFTLEPYELTESDLVAVTKLRDDVYSRWSWNYGRSPAQTMRKSRRFPGCGLIDVFLNVGKEGILQDVTFYGDFFGHEDPGDLANRLKGKLLEPTALRAALSEIDVSSYFHALSRDDLIDLLAI